MSVQMVTWAISREQQKSLKRRVPKEGQIKASAVLFQKLQEGFWQRWGITSKRGSEQSHHIVAPLPPDSYSELVHSEWEILLW